METWLILAGGALVLFLAFKFVMGIFRTIITLAIIGAGAWFLFQHVNW